jgi:hypothetical protein
MCDRAARFRRWLAASALAAAALSPCPAHAQSADQLRTRLLAAARRANTLSDSLRALHKLRARELPPDSLAAGELRFRFLKSNFGADLQASLQSAATHSMAIADSMFGDAVHGIVGAAPITATRSHSSVGQFASLDMVRLEIADGGGRSTLIRAPVTQREIEDGILDLIGTMATAQAPAIATAWAGGWVPSRHLTRESWADAAIDLASSNAAIARTCYAGSVPACESALGLTVVRDSLAEWYTPEGWRVLVSTWRPPKDAFSVIAERAECLEKKANAVCERLARSRPVPIPLNFTTRSSLLGLALERGGRDAYSRLAGAEGTPLQILAAAAGVAPDSLVREWRSRVLAAAPKSAGPSVTEATVFVAWTLIFAFAAGRRRP